MSFLTVLKKSFDLLSSNPKIFLPNYVSGFLWGFYKLLSAQLLLRIQANASQPGNELLLQFLAILAYFFFSVLVSLFVLAMYPFLVEEYKTHKSVSLKKSFKKSLKSFLKLFVAFIVIGFIVVLFFFTALYFYRNFLYLLPFEIQAILGLIALFVFSFLFYSYFPFLLLENKGIVNSLFLSAKLAFKKPVIVSQANLFSLFLSIVSFLLPFFQGNISALFLFWATQFVISTLSTYNYVLNPMVFYYAKQD